MLHYAVAEEPPASSLLRGSYTLDRSIVKSRSFVILDLLRTGRSAWVDSQ